ncbi:hypothetical protein [Runella sp.]|uniref:hypothetical protein n=1 Tax=Runella sp. TaxID=1960881 RepID=UPI00301707BB
MKTFITSLVGVLALTTVMLCHNTSAQCCQGIVTQYTRTDPNYHFYSVVSKPICNVSQKGCTKEFVYEVLTSDIRFVGPTFDDRSVPISNCGTYGVQFFPFDVGVLRGSICVRTNPAQKSVTNYTLPNHLLHPGKVERNITQNANGDIILFSVGTGTGICPDGNVFLADLVWQAESFWDGPNTLLIEEVQRRLSESEGVYAIPADLKPHDARAPKIEVKAGDLVIVEVMTTANMGLFTRDVPAYGVENISRLLLYNREEYFNFNHGALVGKFNNQVIPCIKDPWSRWITPNNRRLLPPQIFPGIIFLASSSGTLSFDLNDKEPDNNWGAFETSVTIIPRSQHRSSELSAALRAYLSNR